LGDVAVNHDRIAAVEHEISGDAELTIDACGLAISPGFIDLHSHSDRTIFEAPTADSKILQGVTTDVVGNCGLSPFPVAAEHRAELADYLSLLEEGADTAIDWVDCAGFAAAVQGVHPAINIAPLVGHGTLRIAVMGTADRQPTSKEMSMMEELLAANLHQGAWGMSSGLIYSPGSFASTEELVALARVLQRQGAIYASHVRGESATLLSAIEEAIAISHASGARTEVSHLKAVGRTFWGQGILALARLEAARSEGVDIWCDQYPYQATATGLSALIPDWVQAGGREKLLPRLALPELHGRLLSDIATAIALRGEADHIKIASTGSQRHRNLCGRTLEDAALRLELSPAEAVLKLLIDEQGVVGAVYFSLGETDLESILRNPDVAVASDGYGFNAELHHSAVPHPRSYGTFPRVLGLYVREKKLLTLETAIRKMTSLPAQILGLEGRGGIKPGFFADLTLFDPLTVRDTATFETPQQYPQGIIHVVVNGQVAVDNARLTANRGGRVLLRK